MKNVLLSIFVFLATINLLAEKKEIEPPSEPHSKKDLTRKFCRFVIANKIVSDQHICHEALEDDSILDELVKLDILDHVDTMESGICIGRR